MPEQSPPALPKVLILTLAEGVHYDSQGKPYLLGLFYEVASNDFPLLLQGSRLFISLTEVYGEISLVLRIVNFEEELPPIYQTTLTFAVDSPLDIIDIDFLVDHASFPSVGEYRIQALVNNGVIEERRFSISNIE